MSESACIFQNGVIKGHNYLNNVVALDAFAQYASLRASASVFPSIILFDLLSTFPSVSWGWLKLALAASGAPKDFCNFVSSLYFNVCAFVSAKGIWQFAFRVTAGVLQGCPLSASLFVIAMDPFSRDFQQHLVHKSYTAIFACADDPGTAVLNLFVLKQPARVFKVMNAVACLVLQIKKCVIAPLVSFNNSNISFIRQWLKANLPKWEGFKIAPYGEYLVFCIGPAAGLAQWTKVISSASHHLASIIASASPPSISVFSYNARVVTKLSYKAQLASLSSNVLNLESRWRCNVLKFPWNSLPPGLVCHGHDYSFYQLDCLEAHAVSAAIRAATTTVTDWHYWYNF